MADINLNDLRSALVSAFTAETGRAVLSDPVSGEWKRISISGMTGGFQAEKFTATQAFHENMDFEAAFEFVFRCLSGSFRQLNSWTGEYEYGIRITKQGKVLKNRRRAAEKPKMRLEHNRQKEYILPAGFASPALHDMGVLTSEGKIASRMEDKYRQINRFVEMVDDAAKDIVQERPVRVIDFGCGKSYLTFILYEYFTRIRKLPVRMTGLDLKEAVIKDCNKAAEKYGYADLNFELGDINGYKADGPVDMVISLHACDTATDYALFNAIGWETRFIFSVPCCQHQLNSQIKTEEFSALTKYGIIRERFSALATDAIRACLLEACGYRVQMLEFVDFAHTPKNILIRAVKADVSKNKRASAYAEALRLIREFSFEPELLRLLKNAGMLPESV